MQLSSMIKQVINVFQFYLLIIVIIKIVCNILIMQRNMN